MKLRLVKVMLTITIFYFEAVRMDITSEHSDMEQLSEFQNDVISCLDIQVIVFYHTASQRNMVMLKVVCLHLVYL
jgi:hypothetical protein